MEIGTNELTRPFRIPRRKNNPDETNDNADEVKRSRAAVDSDLRSPLVAPTTTRRNANSFSRIVPPTKRKAPGDNHNQSLNAKKSIKQRSSGPEVLDKILGIMVNPPKDRRRDVNKEIDESDPNEASNPSKSQNAPTLTYEELQKRYVDNSLCYSFLTKEGLMERLLGLKMLTGRIDSHATLGCMSYDPNDPRRKNYGASSNFDNYSPILKEQQLTGQFNNAPMEERKGPRTPPGSPGQADNSSLISSRGVGSASPSSPPPPPPPPDEEPLNKSDPANDIIAEVAEFTKLPPCRLSECLGEELQNAVKQVDRSVLLNTLKDALIRVGKKEEPSMKSTRALSVKKEQPIINEGEIIETATVEVEMDIESSKSFEEKEQRVLPPPPPAPKTPPFFLSEVNLIAPLNHPTLATSGIPSIGSCILPTPPPPPPIVSTVVAPPPRLSFCHNPSSINMAAPSSTSSAPILPLFNQRPPVKFKNEVSTSPQASSDVTCFNPSIQNPLFTTPPPPTINTNILLRPSLQASRPPLLINETSLGIPAKPPPNADQFSSIANSKIVPLMPFPPPSETIHSNQSSSSTSKKPQPPTFFNSRIDFSKPPPIHNPPPRNISPVSSSALHFMEKSASNFNNPNSSNLLTQELAPTRFPSVYSLKENRTIIANGKSDIVPSVSTLSFSQAPDPFSLYHLSQRTDQLSSTPSIQTYRRNNDSTFMKNDCSSLQSSVPPENNPTPTSQNVIKTLLSALAIPQQSKSPPSAKNSFVPMNNVSGNTQNPTTINFSIQMDHFNRFSRQNSDCINHSQQIFDGNRQYCGFSSSFNPSVLNERQQQEDDSDVVDFSWPPANFEETSNQQTPTESSVMGNMSNMEQEKRQINYSPGRIQCKAPTNSLTNSIRLNSVPDGGNFMNRKLRPPPHAPFIPLRPSHFALPGQSKPLTFFPPQRSIPSLRQIMPERFVRPPFRRY